jgi:hypothetical protein
MSLTKVTYSMINSASINVKDYGAVGDGVADDTDAIRLAIAACYLPTTGSSGRQYAIDLYFPAGDYRITSSIQFAPSNGLIGFTVYGDSMGSTNIYYEGVGTNLQCQFSSTIMFKDIAFWSSGIDDLQQAFYIDQQPGNPLRNWKFERCAFWRFEKCFDVAGSTMCSEFNFHGCYFYQDYYLMVNNNDQAVNWNFVNCNWENESLTTTKPFDGSAIFFLSKGTSSIWTGGSLLVAGRLVFFNLTSSASFADTSHRVTFQGVRLELVPNESGTHAPLLDKTTVGYVSGSNSPTVSILNSTILNRVPIGYALNYFNLWNNCNFSFENVEVSGGFVTAIYDSNTGGLNPNVRMINCKGLSYTQDTTGRLLSHMAPNVVIVPDDATNASLPLVDIRNNNLSVTPSTYAKRIWVRGSTGSLPEGGTTVNLPSLPDHFTIINLFCYRFTVAAQALTVLLRDQADTTTYGTLSLLSGDSNKEAYVGCEMGYQIPSGTALMLKFTGTADSVKGVVGLEYL